MKRFFFFVVLLGAGFTAGYWFHGRRSQTPDTKSAGRKILYWYDPMHPSYRSGKPGTAPDCGMALVPKYQETEEARQYEPPHHDPNRKIVFYRDPAQHSYTSDKPGLNPETGNELQPVYEGDPASMPPGTVRISAEKQQLIGVRMGIVEMSSESRTIRATGRVAPDESRIAHVHTRIEGWIDHVYVHTTGSFVKEGDPLLTLYSPELLATQQEYLLALKARDTLKASPLGGTANRAESLVEAARRRLELLQFSPQRLKEIEQTGNPVVNVTVFAPASGYVVKRNAFHSQMVKPDMELYTIVDLSRVWVMTDVFESELPSIRLGMPAEISLAAAPGRTIRGAVNYIQPEVDATTRTVKVRVEAANPGLLLKPDMFAEVDLHVGSAPRLLVPADAVLDAGERKTVFVDRGNGYLEPRLVQTGERFGGRVVILSGLRAGERIVVSGTFLVDSESQLKSAATAMAGHAHD
jgi:RND family efflux transporter MFP subunit